MAAHTRGTARAEPLRVCTSSLPLARLGPVADRGPAGLVVREPRDRRHLQPLVAARGVDLDVVRAVVALAQVAGADLDDPVGEAEVGDEALDPPGHLLQQRRGLLGGGVGEDLDLVELVGAQQAPGVAAGRAGLAPVARAVGHEALRERRPRAGPRRPPAT